MKEGVMIDNTFAIIDRHLMVKMPREVDHHNAAGIREQTDYYILEDAVDHVIFDFESTVFMDSSGIGILMGRYKKISLFGGRVLAIHVNDRIKKVMQMAGIGEFIEILD